MSKKYNVVISGIQGYVGQELLGLVNLHPYLQLAAVHSQREKDELYQLMPQLLKQAIPVYSTQEIKQNLSQIDILLLATPVRASMEIVAALASSTVIIIDLSAAFRLPEEQFLEWYGIPHEAPQYINEACYGLTPWEKQQSNYQLIANPGCYASCALMSLMPLLTANIIKDDGIIIDAKSGVSGSGKQLNPDLMFCEIANNFYPYKIGKHQHTPEIKKALDKISNKSTSLRLTTSLLPIIRGISMSIYTELNSGFSSDSAISTAINNAFVNAYHDYPLLHFSEIGNDNSINDRFILSLKNVIQTPNTHLGYYVKHGQITLYSCIDNLLKGAASQAIENINAIYQLPLQTGLLPTRRLS